jgi:hypothetical protein
MQARPVTINTVENGLVIQVGCRTFVFESISQAMSEIGRYLTNPVEVEAEYGKRFGFGGVQEGPADVPPGVPPGVNQYIETGSAAGRAIGRR